MAEETRTLGCLHLNTSRKFKTERESERKRDTGNESCTGRRRIIYLRIKMPFHAVICLYRQPFFAVLDLRE